MESIIMGFYLHFDRIKATYVEIGYLNIIHKDSNHNISPWKSTLFTVVLDED